MAALRDGVIIACPHCAGLVLVPTSMRTVNALELLRQRRAQREAGMSVSDGEDSEAPAKTGVDAPPGPLPLTG